MRLSRTSKGFFHWLAGQPGYKSRLQYSDADYFNLSEKDVRVATARREQTGPTLDQVKHVIAMMPADSEIERRNRALIAFTLLTGARESAIASMKLKHVNLAAGCVEQDAHDDEYERPPLMEERAELRNPAKIREEKKRAHNDEDQSAGARSEEHASPNQ